MGRTVTQNELLKPCIHRFLYLLRSGIFLLALMLVACTARPQMPIQRGVQLPMMVPSNVIVGQSIPVTIGPSAEPDGTMVMLIALDSFGPRTYSATLSGGSVRFIIPGEDTQRAGIVLLMARTPNGYGTASIVLQAGPAIAPLTLHVGPHTVPADGISLGMVVAIPNDTYGNAISSGDPVELRFQNPTGTIVTRDVAAQNGIAWIRMPGGTQAGRMLVVGRVGTAHGPEADLSLTAGWPISFTLMADPATLPADGHRLLTLRTSVIRDRYGNPMPDGTLLTLIVTMPDGTMQNIPAYTIDGVAEAPLQAAREPGIAQAIGTVYGMTSMPLEITFSAGPAVGKIQVVAEMDQQSHLLRVRVGPLLGQLGQLTPDGTLVTMVVTDAAGRSQSISGTTDTGYASATIALSALTPGAGRVNVRVGSGQGETAFSVP